MKPNLTYLCFLVVFLALLPASAKETSFKKLPINQFASEELNSIINAKLHWDFMHWNFGKVPKVHFLIGKDHKVSELKVIKYENTDNAQECIRAVFSAEPYAAEYTNQKIEYLCKPITKLSDAEAKRIKKNQVRYMKKVKKKITKNWHPLKTNKSYKLTAKYQIDRTGAVHHIKFTEEYENETVEFMARKAIELSSPFPRPDAETFESLFKGKDSFESSFDFEYNIVPNSSRSAVGLSLGGGMGGFYPAYYYYRQPRPFRR